MLAPAASTARAVAIVCSRDSTVQGPAISAKYSPPIRRPRVWITVGSGDASLDTSLYGLRIGRTLSTPWCCSSARLRMASPSPNAPMTIESVPGATRPYEPASVSSASTSSTCSSADPALIMIRSWSSAGFFDAHVSRA